jgi:hypothetical protein
MYNIVQNPIPRSGLWATQSLEQIQTHIETFPPEMRAQMHHVMMLTLNACNQLVEDRILSKEIFAQ